MELLRGGNVRQLIEASDGLTEKRCLQIALDAARALQAAQRVGLTHRDVKPENILLDDHGTAKLVDFGVARFRKQAAEKLVVGTPYYVAPEVVQQRGPIDFRADIYSLGCTLFHMLAGAPPFESKTVTGVYMARLKQDAPYLCDLDPSIRPETAAVVDRMLQRNPDDRQEDYAQLIADLQWALDTLEAGPRAPEPSDHEALSRALTAPADPAPRQAAASNKPKSRSNAKSRGKKSASVMPFILVALGLILLLGLILFFALQLANNTPPE
jgi:serine/threonine protein kinase